MRSEQIKALVKLTDLDDRLNLNLNLQANKSGQPCTLCGGQKSLKTTDNRYFKCYKCGASGSVYDLLMLVTKCDFKSAHTQLNQLVSTNTITAAQGNNTSLYKKIFQAYQEEYKASHNKRKVDAYLESRGWLKPLEVGYADQSTLINYGLDRWQLEDAGFINEYGEYYKDYLVFPIYDRFNNLVHFSARAMGDQNLRWKSSNAKPPITNYFYNSQALYNPKSDYLVICEGVSDCVSLLQLDVPAIAQFGINVNLQQHAEPFSKFDYLIFVYDQDKYPLGTPLAGKYKSWSQTMPEVVKLLCSISKPAYYLPLPNRSGIKDINDWLMFIDYDLEEYCRYGANNFASIASLAYGMYKDDIDKHHILWQLFKATQDKKAALTLLKDSHLEPVDYLLELAEYL